MTQPTKEAIAKGWNRAVARVNVGNGLSGHEPATPPEPSTAAAKGWRAAAKRANAMRG